MLRKMFNIKAFNLKASSKKRVQKRTDLQTEQVRGLMSREDQKLILMVKG